MGRKLDSVRPTKSPTAGNRFTSFTTTEIPPSSVETTPDQTTEIYNFFGNSTDFHVLDSTVAKTDTTKALPLVSYSTVIGKFIYLYV